MDVGGWLGAELARNASRLAKSTRSKSLNGRRQVNAGGSGVADANDKACVNVVKLI